MNFLRSVADHTEMIHEYTGVAKYHCKGNNDVRKQLSIVLRNLKT